jgi:hypothetical protein
MASIFGFQIGSRFVSTKKYEASLTKEKNDFERFTKFEDSELLRRYNELDTLIHSGEFEKKVHHLKNDKYKDTEQWRQLDQFNAMRSSSDIKSYLKFTRAGKLDRMKSIAKSAEYKEYLELKSYVNSTEFHTAKAQKTFKQSEARAKFQRYKSYLKNTDIKFYLKTERNSEYLSALKLEESERLKTFFKLESLVQSTEFLDHKAFMEDKKRYQKSEESRLVLEFESLKKNEEIVWFLRTKKTNPFKDVRLWDLTFEDDFDGLKPDPVKWMTGYYWGKALMNETYVPAGEKQFFRDDNVDVRDSVLRITARNEKVNGKVWDSKLGFVMQEFNYTSGLISTGQSFRQKYGRFEAKIRFNQTYPVINAFWMVGEKTIPQVDVFRTTSSKGSKVESGIHVSDKDNKVSHLTKTVGGANFKNQYFIYTLEWSAEALVWKVNGLEVHREINNIPKEPMYLSLCTILPENPADSKLPAMLEIDWIRCYKRKED